MIIKYIPHDFPTIVFDIIAYTSGLSKVKY